MIMIFLFFCIILSTAIQSASTKLYSRNGGSSVVFNGIKSIFAFIPLAILSLGNFSPNTETVLIGILYGATLCISMYSGYAALAAGSVTLTSLIVSFSVAIPILYGIFFCGEALTMYKLSGLIFLTIAIIFTNINKSNKKFQSTNALNTGKWATHVLITYISNGIGSVLQKYHQIKYPSLYQSEFTLCAMSVCGIVYLIVYLINIKPQTNKTKGKIHFAVLSGLLTAVSSYLTIKLAGAESASALFPAISAGTIICNLIFGKLIFKENLKYNHIIAVISGILAVILLKL